MTKLRRQDLHSSRAAAALDAIAGWIPAGPYTGTLHPGDIGRALRFDDLTLVRTPSGGLGGGRLATDPPWLS